MADALERGHAEPMRFATLARDFGLHPVYASRAFRRHMGVSMTLYLQTLRLQRARRALATTAVAVHAIAPACGFADASHLCRTFWRAFGLTPVEYRRLTSRG